MENTEFLAGVGIDIEYSSVKPEGYEYDSYSANAIIRYRMDIEFRSWGIKGIQVSLPEQKINISLDMLPKEQEDSIEASLEISIVDSDVEMEKSLNLNSDICPSEIRLQILEIKAVSKDSFVAKAKATLVF